MWCARRRTRGYDSETVAAARADVQPARKNFRRLLPANPNYFGRKPEIGIEVILENQGDTTFDTLGCVAYGPERDGLEATVRVLEAAGYAGSLCTTGSHEHVRFYVSYNGGQRARTPASRAQTSTTSRMCPTARSSRCTRSAAGVGLDFTPKRDRCGKPVLPLVRAILSWEDVPPPNQPDWLPVWGTVRSCHVQITPRPFYFGDIAVKLSKDVLAEIPEYVLEQPPHPRSRPGPGRGFVAPNAG